MENRRYVYAVRIYTENGYRPMAELAFGDGGKPSGETKIIEWSDVTEREKYIINSYTFIWDEREVVKNGTFSNYIENNFNTEPKFHLLNGYKV